MVYAKGERMQRRARGLAPQAPAWEPRGSRRPMLPACSTWLTSFFEVSRRRVRKAPTLRGKTVINLFFEASTRTRTSFEIAGKRLSADVVNIIASSSSVTKGETLLDTVKNLEAMHPDILVVRHGSSGLRIMSRNIRAPRW